MSDIGLREDGTVDFDACREAADRIASDGSPTEDALRRRHTEARDHITGLRGLATRRRLSKKYHLQEIERPQARLQVAPGRVPNCSTCTDSCCIAPHAVRLRLADLARLHDAGLGWGAVQASLRSPLPVVDNGGDAGFHRHPVLAMSDAGRCVFLDERDRCSIYAIRPIVCRRYPYRIDDDLQSIAYATGCKSDRADGDTVEVEALADAAVASFNERLADLLVHELDPKAVGELSLDGYLPEAAAAKEPFEAILARAADSATDRDTGPRQAPTEANEAERGGGEAVEGPRSGGDRDLPADAG